MYGRWNWWVSKVSGRWSIGGSVKCLVDGVGRSVKCMVHGV